MFAIEKNLGDTIGARGGVVDSVTKIKSGCSKFKRFRVQKAARGRLDYACVCSVTLYRSETWPVNQIRENMQAW